MTIEPDTPLIFTIGHMRRHCTDVMAVQDGLSIRGVVTKSQIAHHVSALRDEAVHNATMERWVVE